MNVECFNLHLWDSLGIPESYMYQQKPLAAFPIARSLQVHVSSRRRGEEMKFVRIGCVIRPVYNSTKFPKPNMSEFWLSWLHPGGPHKYKVSLFADLGILMNSCGLFKSAIYPALPFAPFAHVPRFETENMEVPMGSCLFFHPRNYGCPFPTLEVDTHCWWSWNPEAFRAPPFECIQLSVKKSRLKVPTKRESFGCRCLENYHPEN